MSGQHRRTRRTKQSTGIEPYRWLGAGALTFGLGVALASGAGVANADDTGVGGSMNGTDHSSAASESPSRTAEHGSAGADDAPTSGTDKDSTSAGPQKPDAHADNDDTASSTETDDDSPGSERGSEKTHAQQTTESDDDAESSASTDTKISLGDDQETEGGDDTDTTALAMMTQPEQPHTAARTVVEQFSLPTREKTEPTPADIASDDIAPTAAAPAVNPATDLLAAILRQLQQTFFNLTPTAAPHQIATSTNGTITGTVGPDDADGDPLQTTLSQGPVHGSVTVNADGTFSYTPSYTLASSGGTDAFSVTISELNAGDHVHGFQGIVAHIVRTLSGGIINLDDGSTVTKTVTVMVTAGTPTYVVDGVFSPGGTPIGITTGRDGRLWVSRGTSAIAVLDKHGNLIETIDAGEAVSQLAVSADGRIYATTATGIVTIDPAHNNSVSTFTNIDNVQSLAIGADGRVYALTTQGQVAIFEATGQQIATKSDLGQHPIAVAVDATGRIFVTNSEFDTQNVAILDSDGTTRTLSFSGAQEFRAVFGVAVGPDGRAYVASPGSSGIVTILDPDNLPSDISAAESYHSDNGGAYGIAVAGDSRIYLTNYYANTITALAPWFVWP